MRIFEKTQALLAATLVAGGAVLAVAAVKATSTSLTMLALLGAAVVVTELIQVQSDGESLDAMDAHPFSFSSTVHLAAVLIVGSWAAALVAAFGVLAVDALRGARWRQIAYNASVFALAATAGGLAFEQLRASPEAVKLPVDFGALGALALVYYLVNTTFVSAIIAFTGGSAVLPVARHAFWHGLPAAAGEAALAYALARRAVSEPWAIVALVPLVFAVYHAHARLALLRRETARALETFASVVDERDPSTFRHSARVAEHVRCLAQAVGLPASDVVRLRWAGRLHDLGKIGVDASVLRKPGKLDDEEWAAMRRHPRLSARLLRRFRFAAGEARAVEYHHERYDGLGYYGVEPAEIPLAAHFLVVADTFDAMTSDRPYRRGLPPEVALAEIEAGAGRQFHPAVVKAFVAMQRGIDPLTVLTRAEIAALRRASLARGSGRGAVGRLLRGRSEVLAALGLAGGLAALGFELPWLALGCGAAAAAVLGRKYAERARATRLAASLRQALAAPHGAAEAFAASAEILARTAPLRWAGLVAWGDRELDGTVRLEWGDRIARPRETALASWLVREADAGHVPLSTPAAELGGPGHAVALPVGEEPFAGYLVLVFDPSFPRRVELALGACAADLAGALTMTPPGRAAKARQPRRLVAVS